MCHSLTSTRDSAVSSSWPRSQESRRNRWLTGAASQSPPERAKLGGITDFRTIGGLVRWSIWYEHPNYVEARDPRLPLQTGGRRTTRVLSQHNRGIYIIGQSGQPTFSASTTAFCPKQRDNELRIGSSDVERQLRRTRCWRCRSLIVFAPPMSIRCEIHQKCQCSQPRPRHHSAKTRRIRARPNSARCSMRLEADGVLVTAQPPRPIELLAPWPD